MINISCDALVRLSAMIPRAGADVQDIFRTIRLENGRAIVTDRKFMAVELISPFEGVFYIRPTPELIEQCRVETQFNSVLTLVPNPMLSYTTGMTSLAYEVQGNIGVYPVGVTEFDGWWDKIVKPALDPSTVANGALVCHADEVARLAASSPSGAVVFEQHIDVRRPTIIRDINSHDWVGFFHPRVDTGIYHAPATVPGWLK